MTSVQSEFSPAALLQRYLPDAMPETLNTLAKRFSKKSYAKDSAVLRQNEVWQDVWLIESGSLRLSFLRPDGQEFNKNFYGAQALLAPLTPEMRTKPSLFGVHCMSKSQIWHCPYEQWIEILNQQSPQLWAKLQSELLQKLVSHKLQREHDLLTLNARQRYEIFNERFPEIANDIPLKHLASYLGMTNVSLSRIRQKYALNPEKLTSVNDN